MLKLETIGENVFNGSNKLGVGNLPNLISIGKWAFSYCTSLETIGDLRNITEIGYCAFFSCDNLTLRVLPNSYAENYAKSNNIKYTYIKD